jgi:signal transduction histidine kinase
MSSVQKNLPTSRPLVSSTFRLALAYICLFGGSVVLLLGFVYWSTVSYTGRQVDETIRAEITTFSERYRVSGLSGLTDLITGHLSSQPAGPSIYLLATANRGTIVGNLSAWPATVPDSDGWLDFRLGDGDQDESSPHRARARVFRLRGNFLLLVGRDMHELTEFRQLIVRTIGWGMAITAVLALVGGWALSLASVRRIAAINATLDAIMSGDLSTRVPADHTGDEFGQLSGNLNLMLDRIQELMAGIQQVSDNIAHDLRTPLARLRNRLDRLRQQLGRGEMAESADQAIAEAESLLHTFGALLRIARLEAGGRRLEQSEVELGTLVADVIELYEPVAEQRGLELSVSPGAAITVTADRDLVFQALANLVDNALKYTPRGGRVAVILTASENGATIEVTDNGPGVPSDQRDKVFERFYRLDPSRSSPGSGLGLSLVSAVLRLHNGQVQLRDNAPGLRVILALPRSA